MRTGADALVEQLTASGVVACFTNPGTSEVDLVRALDGAGTIRSCLVLQENVATGAADGYARVMGRPAMVLLHLGPGLANGIANLHNARRACSPVVTVIGQHPTWHVAADSPLASDIDALAGTVSRWVRQTCDVSVVARDACDAVAAALGPPSGVATLVVPMDVQRSSVEISTAPRSAAAQARVVDPQAVDEAARLVRRGPATAMWIGGAALSGDGLRVADRIRAATGCRVFSESYPARADRGGGLPSFAPIPYFPEQAVAALDGVTSAVLVGTGPPTYMFGGPDGTSSPLPPAVSVVALPEAPLQVLDAIVDSLGPAPDAVPTEPASGIVVAPGRLDGTSAGATVARLLPEDAVVVDESGTSGTGYHASADSAARHVRLGVTGGAIGMGLPAAIGAAVAAPGRRVVSLQADGSAMYTIQSLWTMARESLDITVVLLANHRYGILATEFARAGMERPGALASSLIDLSNPALDWVRMSEAHGVPARRARTVDELTVALDRSFGTAGPMLIEATV